MASNRITINGQPYDSPDAMPPDVRRMYEEAMRTVESSLAGTQSGGSTQVFTGRAGEHVDPSVVVNRVVTINDHTYGSIDELPPDARQLYEDALQGATSHVTRPRTGLHLSVNMTGPEIRTRDDSRRAPTPRPLPIETSTEATIRNLPMNIAFGIAIVLVLWFLLGR